MLNENKRHMINVRILSLVLAVLMFVGTIYQLGTAGTGAVHHDPTCDDYTNQKKEINDEDVLRLVSVNTDVELSDAIANAVPGDLIEIADGTYFGTMSLIDINGTSSAPITIQAKNQHGAKFTDNPYGYTPQIIYMANSSYLSIYGLEVDGDAGLIGIGIGYDGSSVSKPAGDVNNIDISHNKVHNTRQAGLQIGKPSGSSSDIQISCNSIFDTGTETALYGEGIYIGDGASLNATVHDVIITGNDIYQTGAEAIDVKAPSYNITISDNSIHDSTISWTGAIALGLDRVDYRDGNYLVENNYIYNISSDPLAPHNGNGIVSGHGTTTIRNNVIWNIEDNAVSFYERDLTPVNIGFGSSNSRAVNIYNNTMFNCGDECVGEHPLTTVGAPDGSIRTVINNIGSSNLASDELNLQTGNYIATVADFIGPVSNNANAGQGEGSGFALLKSSPSVDSAVTLTDFNVDILGQNRPSGSGWDHGAFELRQSKFRKCRRFKKKCPPGQRRLERHQQAQ